MSQTRKSKFLLKLLSTKLRRLLSKSFFILLTSTLLSRQINRSVLTLKSKIVGRIRGESFRVWKERKGERRKRLESLEGAVEVGGRGEVRKAWGVWEREVR